MAIFISARFTVKDPRVDVARSTVQRAIRDAAKGCNYHQPIGAHTLRLSFATRLLQKSIDLRLIQRLMAHSGISTTKLYLRVLGAMADKIENPIDEEMPLNKKQRSKTPKYLQASLSQALKYKNTMLIPKRNRSRFHNIFEKFF